MTGGRRGAKTFDFSRAGYPWYEDPVVQTPADTEAVMRKVLEDLEVQIRLMFLGGYVIDPKALAEIAATLETQPMPRFARSPRPPAHRLNEGDDPAVPPGKVCFTAGAGTYHARLRLRALGGLWDKLLLGGCWVVPAETADAAEANVRLAERAGVDLPLDEDPAGVPVEQLTCYVCGTKYAPWEFAQLKGAVVSDWYCGCETRKGPAPRTATTRGTRW